MAYLIPHTDLSLVCMPLRTLDELINFYKNPVQWKTLVEPLASRTDPKKYTKFSADSEDIEESDESVSSMVDTEIRREILVCHDFKGNLKKIVRH